MGLKDRALDLIASLFSPTMDHPSKGGMTGEEFPPEEAEDDDTER
jgi:hypothetical protein